MDNRGCILLHPWVVCKAAVICCNVVDPFLEQMRRWLHPNAHRLARFPLQDLSFQSVLLLSNFSLEQDRLGHACCQIVIYLEDLTSVLISHVLELFALLWAFQLVTYLCLLEQATKRAAMDIVSHKVLTVLQHVFFSYIQSWQDEMRLAASDFRVNSLVQLRDRLIKFAKEERLTMSFVAWTFR